MFRPAPIRIITLIATCAMALAALGLTAVLATSHAVALPGPTACLFTSAMGLNQHATLQHGAIKIGSARCLTVD